MKKLGTSLFIGTFLLSAGIASATTTPVKKPVTITTKATVTSTDCAGNIEKLRLLGQKEMAARRDKALLKAKKLGTEKERLDAKKKAETAYANELKVAEKQLVAAKALCKKPATGTKPKPLPPAATTTSPKPLPSATVTPNAPKTVTATISNFDFAPTRIKIRKGDTIVWTNKDSAPHTVTANGSEFVSDTLAQNQTFSFTFTKTGTFQYRCAFHASMVGVVEVIE